MTHPSDRHPDEGALRRLLDEPDSISGAGRIHYDGCAGCHATLARIALTAQQSAQLLSDSPPGDATDALAAVRARAATPGWRRLTAARVGWPLAIRRRRRVLLASAVSGSLVVGAALTATAYGALGVFAPQRVTPVQVAPSELHGLPDLSAFGRETLPAMPRPRRLADAEAAAVVSGLAIRPPALPSSVRNRTAAYYVVDPVSGSFTFDANRARSSAASHQRTLPPMPAGIDGASISVSIGPTVIRVYGGNLDALYGEGGAGALPQLVIGEVRAPSVRVSGAGLIEIENYLLSMPGISANLAAQIRAIGDPSSSLPIPIPLGSGHPVTINGNSGVAVGDGTGVGSVVIWEHAGTVRAVGGTLGEEDVLAIARSLH